jgi:UPF0148 protein
MSREETVKDMADLLRSGAVMLSEQCPVCEGIIFKLRNGEKVCPNCRKSSEKIINSHIESKTTIRSDELDVIERILFSKLQNATKKISETSELSDMTPLLHLCNEITTVLEKVHNLRK